MKIRKGFVSNSSTSCFLCDVCGELDGWMDASLGEVGMVKCVNDHQFCEEHKLDVGDMNPLKMRDILVSQIWSEEDKHTFNAFTEEEAREFFESDEGSDYWSDYTEGIVFTAECPICQFEEITATVAARYLMRFAGLTKAQLSAIMKGKYTSFTDFLEKTK